MGHVDNKYMTTVPNEEELRATFAARWDILDFLTDRLREQGRSSTFTSYLMTGPRGAGKTTLLLMLCLRLREDEEWGSAWLPVRLPEELPGVTSLRDLLVAVLRLLDEDGGVSEAGQWRDRAESEPSDEQSLELAITGLRRVAERQQKRLILLIENLHQVFERKLDDQSKAALRRLLMVDPFMMIVGTAVRMFEAVQDYEKPFFNYFCPIPLERLDDEQVRAILFQRAEHDGNDEFEKQYRRHEDKIRAITWLTGGNPRLVLMLYEVLTHGNIASAVTALRNLIDELTPLLKDVLENQFSAQQTKVLDALMRAGGTATPTAIAQASRLTPNTVTTQLQRLKEMQVVEVQGGGGRGRPAYYSVPDPLFRTWYQLRYLRLQRQRIEMFVEVLRIWFGEDARLRTLRDLANEAGQDVRARAASQAYRTAWQCGDRTHCDEVLEAATEAFGQLESKDRAESIGATLFALASPDMREGWPYALPKLLTGLPDEFANIFRPAAEILETGDRSKLDPLPPEQREFVKEILKRFEADDAIP